MRPLLAAGDGARMRGRRVVRTQQNGAGLHWLAGHHFMPALCCWPKTIVMFSPLCGAELAADPMWGWTGKKCGAGTLPHEYRGARRKSRLQAPAASLPPRESGPVW